MALLRWMHLRQARAARRADCRRWARAGAAGGTPRRGAPDGAAATRRPAAALPPRAPARARAGASTRPRRAAPPPPPRAAAPALGVRTAPATPEPARRRRAVAAAPLAPDRVKARLPRGDPQARRSCCTAPSSAQAQRIEVAGDASRSASGRSTASLRKQVEQNRGVLEEIAERRGGTPDAVRGRRRTPRRPAAARPHGPDEGRQPRLRERALADPAVQAMLDVLPGRDPDVEEIDG